MKAWHKKSTEVRTRGAASLIGYKGQTRPEVEMKPSLGARTKEKWSQVLGAENFCQ